MNKRRILFLVLLTVDFFYFLALLIYQVIKRRQGDLPAQQSGITGDGDQPVAVWIGTTGKLCRAAQMPMLLHIGLA